MNATATRQAAPPSPEEIDPATTDGAASLPRAGALARLLGPVRGHLVGCGVLSALAAGAGSVPYIAAAEVARLLATDGTSADPATIWRWVILGAAGAVGRLLLVFSSSRLGHFADARILHELRRRMVRSLGSVPLGWFRDRGSGQIKRRLTNDLEEMHQLIAHSLGEIVGAATAVTVGLAYLFFVDWRMALVTAGALAALGISYRTAMRSMTSHMNRLLAAEGRIGTASVEYADGVSVVKAFGTDGQALRRFTAAVDEHTAALAAWAAETRYSTAAARLLASEMTLLAILAAVGLALVDAGSLSFASLLPFLIVGIGLPTSINPAIHGSHGLRKGRAAAQNIESLLTWPPLPEPREPRSPHGHEVEFDGVSFSYDGDVMAVDDLSAVCEPGTVTAIVGPSGAGKSTLAGLIPRFYDVTRGAIRLGGVDVRAMDERTLLSSITLVFQDVMLVRDTIAENIRIAAPGASDENVRAAARAARIDDVIERLPHGYDTVLGDDTGLSGGERQRLTIARAILSDAPVIVLDEATASLDPDNETAVQRALSHLVRGKTVIVIAHRLRTIADADQILVLDRGRLVEKGRHSTLLAERGLYARLWQAQTAGGTP
ncbi:ATP-binding cassette subfamily B protein [Actinoalloteichus hoggarensis]|uniref:Iron import ATP-binding/permease protein IrtA n=1 Tax=Actinoalloteichus hoggarensis TaxID=1470176 RepID=A0A221W731_9PSEU|nr:ABC transporter ATP-binding protein [Actinoalloteichus hoggarensis]ASO21511.1 Iron import ATP-binding/permease protein IrtA [Actinoalloteichus hoggarensis]MBB5922100.1 ATP-binding cassette subfamily B protein [Actinoalloteichus hoggarensis]